MFTPMMGMPFVPTRLAVFRNVPSPPIEMAKSAWKSSSHDGSTTTSPPKALSVWLTF